MRVQGIECPLCGDRVWSRATHDMRYCRCGYCFVDGGRSYSRIGYGGDGFPRPWKVPREIEIEVDNA